MTHPTASPATTPPSPPASVAGNAAALLVSQVLIKLVNIAVSLLMVRWLGPEELGRYSYVVAFCFPFGALADFGLATLGIRELSRSPGRERTVYDTLQRTLLALSVVAAAGMVAAAVALRHPGDVLAGVALVAAATIVSALTTPALVRLTAQERLQRVSAHRLLGAALSSSAVLVTLLAGGRTLALLAAALGVQVVAMVLAHWLAGSAPGFSASTAGIVRLARAALPFGVLMVVFALAYRVDVVMVEWLRSTRDVGLYAAGYRFLDAVMVVAAAIGSPFYPRLARLVATDPDAVRRVLEASWRPMLALGLPLSLGAAWAAPDVVALLWGADFEPSGRVARVLMAAALPVLLVNILNHAVIAADDVWRLAGVYGTTTLVNVVANLVLLPSVGVLGAALATVLAEWLALGLVLVLVRRRFGFSLATAGLWRYAVALAAMALVMHVTSPYGLPALVGAALAGYAGALLATGYARSDDMAQLRRLLAW